MVVTPQEKVDHVGIVALVTGTPITALLVRLTTPQFHQKHPILHGAINGIVLSWIKMCLTELKKSTPTVCISHVKMQMLCTVPLEKSALEDMLS